MLLFNVFTMYLGFADKKPASEKTSSCSDCGEYSKCSRYKKNFALGLYYVYSILIFHKTEFELSPKHAIDLDIILIYCDIL